MKVKPYLDLFEKIELSELRFYNGLMSEKPNAQEQTLTLDQVVLDPAVREQVRQLVRNHAQTRQEMLRWGVARRIPDHLLLAISGASGLGKSVLAQALAAECGCEPICCFWPRGAPERIEKLVEQAVAEERFLIVDCGEGVSLDSAAVFQQALAGSGAMAVLTIVDVDGLPDNIWSRVHFHIQLTMPSATLREQLWELHLPLGVPLAVGIDVATLAASYALTGAQIANAVALAAHVAVGRGPTGPEITMDDLVAGAEAQLFGYPHLNGLAYNLELSEKDLILPESAQTQFAELVEASQHRRQILRDIGPVGQPPALLALIDGPPGTGKTFAGSVLASICRRPLISFNVAQLSAMSTSAVLAELEQRASLMERTRALLLFDEADTLFAGPQARADALSQLLLQMTEGLETVVLFTTRTFGSDETVLKRRLDLRVSFSFPDAPVRARLWKRYLASTTQKGAAIDVDRLGRCFELPGAHIRKAIARALTRARAKGVELNTELIQEAGIRECQAIGTLFRLENKIRPLQDRTKIIRVTPANIDESILKPPE